MVDGLEEVGLDPSMLGDDSFDLERARLRLEGGGSEMDGGWLSGEDEEETRWVGGGGEDLMDGWDRPRVSSAYIYSKWFRLGVFSPSDRNQTVENK